MTFGAEGQALSFSGVGEWRILIPSRQIQAVSHRRDGHEHVDKTRLYFFWRVFRQRTLTRVLFSCEEHGPCESSKDRVLRALRPDRFENSFTRLPGGKQGGVALRDLHLDLKIRGCCSLQRADFL